MPAATAWKTPSSRPSGTDAVIYAVGVFSDDDIKHNPSYEKSARAL
jgi:hypothetical protein